MVLWNSWQPFTKAWRKGISSTYDPEIIRLVPYQLALNHTSNEDEEDHIQVPSCGNWSLLHNCNITLGNDYHAKMTKLDLLGNNSAFKPHDLFWNGTEEKVHELNSCFCIHQVSRFKMLTKNKYEILLFCCCIMQNCSEWAWTSFLLQNMTHFACMDPLLSIAFYPDLDSFLHRHPIHQIPAQRSRQLS